MDLDEKNLPSNKKFGAFFGSVFVAMAAYYYVIGDTYVAAVSCVASAVLFLITFLFSRVLSPFNRGWMMLGHLLGQIVNPIVMGAIFFLFLTPVSFIGRLLGRDELRLKNIKAKSYWIHRNPSAVEKSSFNNQF